MKILMILIIPSLIFCCSTKQSGIDCGFCIDSAGEISETSPADVTSDGEVLPSKGAVGDFCKEGSECETEFCLTAGFLTGMGLNIPDLDPDWGECSKLPCEKDDECGAQGSCFDSQPFSGAPFKLCLHKCKTYLDCKYNMSESCFEDPGMSDTGACLPDAVIAAILCGNGTCDENEKASGKCPDDCK
jgi:hypothetical protein